MSKPKTPKSVPVTTSNGSTAMLVRGDLADATRSPMAELAHVAAELGAIESCPVMADTDSVHLLTPYGTRIALTGRELKSQALKAAKSVFAEGFRIAAGLSSQRIRDNAGERKAAGPVVTDIEAE